MKKTIISILTAVLAASTLTNTSIASAEEKPTQSAQSKATVTFEAPTNKVEPVNPREPLSEENYTSSKEDDVVTGYKGPLSLDVVPNFNFGEAKITSKETILPAKNNAPYIQVSDFRGPEGGWHVQAQLSEFHLSDELSKTTLPQAKITFSNGEINSTLDPESAPAKPSQMESSIELVSGAPVNDIVSAAKATEKKQAEGLGTWVIRWLADEATSESNENVKLTVPAFEASEGTHEATINWTLTDAPGVTGKDS